MQNLHGVRHGWSRGSSRSQIAVGCGGTSLKGENKDIGREPCERNPGEIESLALPAPIAPSGDGGAVVELSRRMR